MDGDAAIQQLLDRQNVTDTLYRYASTIDAKDYAGLRSVFADDARARYGKGDWLVGADQIVAWIAEHGSTRSWQHHLVSVYHVDIDGDAARTVMYHTSHQTTFDEPDTVRVIVARYFDELRRIAGVWKITEKYMEVGWRESRHASQANP
jgi:3-phenylpropionate/cinnamic acid dioxygenase small subunit